jgi:hypothetical protein
MLLCDCISSIYAIPLFLYITTMSSRKWTISSVWQDLWGSWWQACLALTRKKCMKMKTLAFGMHFQTITYDISFYMIYADAAVRSSLFPCITPHVCLCKQFREHLSLHRLIMEQIEAHLIHLWSLIKNRFVSACLSEKFGR